MKIENIHPGDILYTIYKHTMGNTTVRIVGVYEVVVKEVNIERGYVIACTNGNPPVMHFKNSWSKWRRKKPVLVSGMFGKLRLARRGEV